MLQYFAFSCHLSRAHCSTAFRKIYKAMPAVDNMQGISDFPLLDYKCLMKSMTAEKTHSLHKSLHPEGLRILKSSSDDSIFRLAVLSALE